MTKQSENEALREKIMILERRLQVIQDAIAKLVREVK